MGSNDLPVKKIYIDSKFKRHDSVSSSNFKIELPYTLKLPDNAIFYVDDVCIPHNWYTVEAGVNDKLYFRLQVQGGGAVNDYIITLSSKIYNGTQFAAEVQSKITAATSQTTTCVYDQQTRQISILIGVLETNFWTDDVLKLVVNNVTWFGPTFDRGHLSSGNDLLSNNNKQTSPKDLDVQYYLSLQPVRNIYMRSPNISSFNTIGCNGESSVIKKIPVSSNQGEMIFNNITSANDFLDCSRATWKTLEFHLVDVNSNYINLHGADVSFSLILDKQLPDQ
jgi:hypothetical protein